MAQLAFLTIGFLRQAEGHPEVQGFYDRMDAIWQVVDSIPGHIRTVDARVSREPPCSTFFQPDIHACYADTLSVWSDPESLFAFAYFGFHGEAFRRRSEWFLKTEYPNHAAWWVEDSHVPDWIEAYQRQSLLHAEGPTSQTFNLRRTFDAAGNILTIDREKVKQIVADCPGLAAFARSEGLPN